MLDVGIWERACGWALWKALITADKSKRVIDEILGDAYVDEPQEPSRLKR